MTHSSFLRRLFVDHRRSVTLCLLALLLGGYLWAPSEIRAQTAVTLSPLPIQQLFNANGVPLAFGCVFSYQVATSTPLSTYTDYTGTTLNANPVILSASGTYSMWLQAGVSYSLVVKSAGGTNCSSGSTIAFLNGVGGGSTTLTTVVPYSATPAFTVAAQNQLFEITLTGNASAQPLTFVGITPPSYVVFQVTQDASGGHTFSWPANSVGGCSINPAANSVTQLMFVYNGSTATAVGPCVSGSSIFVGAITATSIVDLGPLTVDGFSLLNGFLGCVEGTAPTGVSTEDIFWCDSTGHRWGMNNDAGTNDFVVGENTTDTFTNKTYDTAGAGNVFKINSNAISAVEGNTAKAQLAGTISGTGVPLCTDASGNDTTSGCPNYGIDYYFTFTTCTVPSGANAQCAGTVTFIASGGNTTPSFPAMADGAYIATCTVDDGGSGNSSNTAFAINLQSRSTTHFGYAVGNAVSDIASGETLTGMCHLHHN